ncbi:phage/plasmid primase, P4 family [Streptomyces malaysiensis]
MEISTILDRFGGAAEHSDGGYIARCPSHDDSDPSLRIWVGENRKVRLNCRAGCDSDDVIKAAGLRWPDLFDVTGDAVTVPSEPPSLVGVRETAALAMYIYDMSERLTDDSSWAEDARVYLGRRFGLDPVHAQSLGVGLDTGVVVHPFAYRSPAFKAYPRLTVPLYNFTGVAHGLQGRDITGDCPGRWLSLTNPQGHRWGQYGVFRGQGDHGVTIVSEGPGDGLTAVSVGYDAVVIRGAGLAGNPELLAELAAGLRGRRVVAAGDNDSAGQKFNRALADGLRPHGIEVFAIGIPDLGPKTDITAWREDNPEGFASVFHEEVAQAKLIEPEEGKPVAISGTIVEPRDNDAVTRADGEEASRILDEMEARFTESDAANAHALAKWSGRIKFSDALGFYVWNGKVWEPSSKKLRNQIHLMGAALALVGKASKAKPFVTTRRIDEMVKELKSVPGVFVAADAFDQNLDVLAFRNGVVDLRTGKMREHRPEDMNTAVLDIDYDPDAKCPGWDKFLVEIMPGMPEMPAYLQRLVGYGITGRTTEQCFAVFHGKGANGKSVFVDATAKIFRAVTKNTPFETFEERSRGGIPNDIAALRDARLVTSSEGDSGRPMSEAVLKRATGGDEMTARFLQKEFFTFTPKFLILMATNHKPTFRGQDEGLWRRVKMVPFKRYFAPDEREDRAVMDRRFQVEEAQGIAAWAVRGAMEWYRNGLGDPDVVKDATKDFRETSDTLQGFCPGICEVTKGADDMVPGSDLFTAYLEWCEAENLPLRERWKRTTFYRAMEERGAVRKKLANGINLVGVRMCDAFEREIHAVTSGPGIFGADS